MAGSSSGAERLEIQKEAGLARDKPRLTQGNDSLASFLLSCQCSLGLGPQRRYSALASCLFYLFCMSGGRMSVPLSQVFGARTDRPQRMENDSLHSVIRACRADRKDLKCVSEWGWAARRQKGGCV